MLPIRTLAALALLFLPARALHAVDGVAEINQVCATQSGCFPGDTAGFPVTIDGSVGRSYRLTSDLTVPTSNDGGILVLFTAPGVDIDLNGFSIVGPITCSAGASTSCSGSGTGVGVKFNLPTGSVRNGSIQGMGASGVEIGAEGEVSGLHVRWSGAVGISAGEGSTVRDNKVFQNASHGIEAGDEVLLIANHARENGGSGMVVGVNARVGASSSIGNDVSGVEIGRGSQLLDSVSSRNGGDGVAIADKSLVSRVEVVDNEGYGFNGTGSTQTVVWDSLCFNNSSGNSNSPSVISFTGSAC